jgi:molybdate transport system substrate-binding protein
MIRRWRASVAAAVVGASLVVGCGGGRDADEPGQGVVTVFAAASLAASFTEIGAAFEADRPGTSVRLSFAASSDLVTQIAEGAPADVFASADEVNMARLVDGVGTLSEPVVFATNRLVIIVEPGNPLDISGVEDLADSELLFVTASPEVPIGRYTQQVLRDAQVDVTPRSFEDNVRGIVNKVVLGEADAGIVYATDVRAANGEADGIEIPRDLNVTARYPIAIPAEAPDRLAAAAFVDFVLSDAGQAILQSYGFGAPS